MKLATALSERADLQKKLAELGNRLNQNAKVQEGEEPAEAPEELLAELDREQAVSVAQLCRATGASGATIRRDLNELARRGRLNKVYGGAMSIREEFRAEEPDMEVKRELHTQEKLRIARYAASLIQDGDVVFLDAGSTVMHMVDHIQASGAVFVTNSVECVQRLPLRGPRFPSPWLWPPWNSRDARSMCWTPRAGSTSPARPWRP